MTDAACPGPGDTGAGGELAEAEQAACESVDLADPFPMRDHVYYDRAAAEMGEDGEAWMAAGHDRRSYAALNAVARYEGGPRPMSGMKYTIERSWITCVVTCGCTEEEHTLHDTDPPEGIKLGTSEAEPYDGCWTHCEHPYLPPCNDIHAWSGVDVTADVPGAIPVLTMRIDWRRTDAH